MRPGGDVLAALVVALAIHAGLGALLLGPAGQPGAGREGSVVAAVALAPATAGALADAWRTPPSVGEVGDVPPPAPPLADLPAVQTPAGDVPGRMDAPSGPPTPAQVDPLPQRPARPDAPPRLADLSGIEPDSATGQTADSFEAAQPVRTGTDIAPDRSGIAALPQTTAETRPEIGSRPPEPMTSRGPAPSRQRPQARPEAVATAPAPPVATGQAASAIASARIGGRGATTGEAGRLQALWAGEIAAKIARAQRHPGPEHGAGRVRITLVVARDGRLADIRIAASSGSPGLDRAAVEAVRRAAPFPRAPQELPDDWMRFGQWIAFRAR